MTRPNARSVVSIGLLLLSIAGAARVADLRVAEAQTAVAPEDVAEIARSLNCPLCQGYNLQDCPLEVCAQMRELIRVRLAEGATRDEIVDAFVADYGPQVLNAPPAEGFFASAWVLPVVGLVVGILVGAAILVRGAARQTSAGDAGDQATDARYVEALERLARFEEDG